MNKPAFKLYQDGIEKKLQQAFQQEKEITLAANLIADSLSNQGWIYASGTGHSHLIAEEIFYRAGGFARVIPILDPELMLHQNASGSTALERKEGYAAQLLKEFKITPNDVFIISSNSGRNAVSIEMAQLAKSSGAKVIGLTNLSHSRSVKSRHSSGLKLYELSDIYLDNFGEIGDASIQLTGLETRVGATSTVIGVALLQAIMVQAATTLISRGFKPEIFSSSNSDVGEAENEALLTKYKPLVKGL
ncbi:sugar isomerase domain-containing protein [Algoriphagus litoralis]|uniref:sugar isomerase domain-containing protein n=1 Tax=Algoriphagus litoralis TaxID=2202829 RepID=UPI000DBA32EB|nr:SIS domain-containing protein [Algoriphagus litoralis]